MCVFVQGKEMIDFDYCLAHDQIESGLQSLMMELPFDEKVTCVQVIGEWICRHFSSEKNATRKREIALRAADNLSNILALTPRAGASETHKDPTSVIIEQYLQQIKTGLCR